MSDIVDIAEKEIGYQEYGNNKTKYGAWFGNNGVKWCHIFVSWCADQCGIGTDIIPRTASTDTGMAWFKKQGLFKIKGQYTPGRGDIVYFKTERSHVGIVEKTLGGKVYTIEGNSGQVVKRKNYALSEKTITGYGVPKYRDSGKNETPEDGASKELAFLKKVLERKEPVPYPGVAKLVPLELRGKNTIHLELMITEQGQSFFVPVLEGMQLVLERVGAPGKLTFKTIIDRSLRITEGAGVSLTVNKMVMFKGFVFTKQTDRENILSITAYDQLRYLKNKDCYFYENKTASELLKKIAADYRLKIGWIADTKYRLTRNEEDNTLFDIIQNALDETSFATGKFYTLGDRAGKITLMESGYLKWNYCVIEEGSIEDYTYKTSIDANTYNRIKLGYENKKTGKLETYVNQNSENMFRWGTLQYFEKISSPNPELGKVKGEVLLRYYNRKTRSLSIKNAFGNKSVIAGCLVPVILNLEDCKLQHMMMVEKVTHKFSDSLHEMDLILSGGNFDA